MPIDYAQHVYINSGDVDNGIIDFPSGERIEFSKVKDKNDQLLSIIISHYDKDDHLLENCTLNPIMCEGGPLKEDPDGKILKPGDKGYEKANRLCFNIQVETYHEDIETLCHNFNRTVKFVKGRYQHYIKLTTYDRNGEVDYEGETMVPKYSERALKARYLKVSTGIYKTDLKEIRDNLQYQKLDPADIPDFEFD